MKNLKLFSVLTILVTIIAALVSVLNFHGSRKIELSKIEYAREDSVRINQPVPGGGGHIKSKIVMLPVKKGEIYSPSNRAKNSAIQNQPIKNEDLNSIFSDPKYLGKLFFSTIFSFAALFVVLSNRYDEETKKWAFSILSLVAGIWIGTL